MRDMRVPGTWWRATASVRRQDAQGQACVLGVSNSSPRRCGGVQEIRTGPEYRAFAVVSSLGHGAWISDQAQEKREILTLVLRSIVDAYSFCLDHNRSQQIEPRHVANTLAQPDIDHLGAIEW